MVHDNRNLEQYIEKCGSVYAATIFVGRQARKLAENFDNIISHAEALSWLLSGDVPDTIEHYHERSLRREQRVLSYAKEYLDNILDKQVANSVLKSLELSKQANHLIYHYEEVYDKYRQARVRILTNKLWSELREMQEFR